MAPASDSVARKKSAQALEGGREVLAYRGGGKNMKIRELLKAQKATILLTLTALSLLTFCISMFTTSASQDGKRQGRGRILTRRHDLQPASPSGDPPAITDAAALEALSQIQNFEGNIHNNFHTRSIRIDVAENGRKFTPDDTPVFPDGLPAYGNEFITEGYIYPSGTINDTSGVKENGDPEFPDKVIGRWYCRGWHVGDGANTATGPGVITHQLYDFVTQPGRITITTDGVELVDANVPFHRAITGGTGPYALARGEATQTLLGFPNVAGGVNLRLELKVAVR
jgi:hypothetical protein